MTDTVTRQAVQMIESQDLTHWTDEHDDVVLASLKAALAAPQSTMLTDAEERTAFEAWISKDRGDISTFGVGANTHYQNSAVNNSWTGWRQRAIEAATKRGAK